MRQMLSTCEERLSRNSPEECLRAEGGVGDLVEGTSELTTLGVVTGEAAAVREKGEAAAAVAAAIVPGLGAEAVAMARLVRLGRAPEGFELDGTGV